MIEIACFCVGFLAGVIAAFAALHRMDKAISITKLDQ